MDAELRHTLAETIQDDFPVRERPFRVLGDRLGVQESEVLAQMRAWDGEKLREISAILEGEAFGWDSALVAGRVEPERIEEVAAIVNRHPTVTHNYERDHHYNLWFTIAVPPRMPMERTLEMLSRATGVAPFHPLRRTETYKIGVNFDLDSKESSTERVELESPERLEPDERQRRMFRALQKPLEIVERPFDRLAEWAGTDVAELLAFGRGMEQRGAVRRYVATFHHRDLGVRGNGMTVWDVEPERRSDVGRRLAEAPEVSHCYARNAIPRFPYTVYSMIHGPDEGSVRRIARRLSDRVDVDDYRILFSSREFKKCRLRYFLPQLQKWWGQRRCD
ncbi:MAG: hypothetical protein ABEL76_09750 [Bradymonadaceae bacterium]